MYHTGLKTSAKEKSHKQSLIKSASTILNKKVTFSVSLRCIVTATKHSRYKKMQSIHIAKKSLALGSDGTVLQFLLQDFRDLQ